MSTNETPQAAPILSDYDRYIVAFSGGKDSLACVLHLLDEGVDPSKVELWHHDIDGGEGSDLMDWACTRDYCRKVGEALGIEVYFSWKQGGFEREMLREDSLTAPIVFENEKRELVSVGGTRGKKNTRRMFPQVTADLSRRWCSAYLKIDVCSSAIRNQPRFEQGKTLLLTGERAEESPGRARYASFEPDRSDLRNGKRVKRWVDHWRPVHAWTEAQVWEIIEKHSINPHPAYRLGWGRVSCAACIFGSANQWASLDAIDPTRVDRIAAYEEDFGKTIHRTKSVREQSSNGTAYEGMHPDTIAAALSHAFAEPIILPEGTWELPAGAFGESCGPI